MVLEVVTLFTTLVKDCLGAAASKKESTTDVANEMSVFLPQCISNLRSTNMILVNLDLPNEVLESVQALVSEIRLVGKM